MRYVYILFISLILFYIISRYFEKYYSHENFDPSLVPVSSIITLAKVAQKIVDGNGTLTNPGNLAIGIPSAKGNLTVTGNSTTNGNKQIDGTLGVTGATTLSNTLGVTGATTLSNTLGVTGNTTLTGGVTGGLKVTGNTSTTGTLAVGGTDTQGYTLGVNGNTGVNGTLGVTGATTIGASGTPLTTTNLTVNGGTVINGNTNIGGTLTVNGTTTIGNTNINGVVTFPNNSWHKSSDGAVRHYYLNNSDTYIGSPNAWRFQSSTGPTDVVTIDKSGNMTVNGTLSIGGIILSNVGGQLKISTGVSANGAFTANVPRGSGAFTITGPGGYPDQSTILRSGYGQTYNVDYMYQGNQNYGVSTWGGGGGTCTNNNNGACK
jgi:hypothetical protein